MTHAQNPLENFLDMALKKDYINCINTVDTYDWLNGLEGGKAGVP